MAPLLLGLVLVLSGAGLACAEADCPGDPAPRDLERFREAVSRHLSDASGPPERDDRLDRAAARLAVEIGDGRSGPSLADAIAAEGYSLAEASAALVVGGRDPALAAERAAGQLRDPPMPPRELGVATLEGASGPVWVAILARSLHTRSAELFASLPDRDDLRRQVLDEVNHERASRGSPRLEADPCLEEAAQAYARRTLDDRRLEHVDADGHRAMERVRDRGCAFRSLGENLASGPTTAAEVVAGWMASPGHRRNLLEPTFTRMGLGVVWVQDDDGSPRIHWVQLLGSE